MANANPNISNKKYGQTPLHYAVDLGDNNIAEMMLAYDASPLIKDKCSKTAMDLAGSPEMQRVLVEPPKHPESPIIRAFSETFEEKDCPPAVIKVPESPFGPSVRSTMDSPTKGAHIFDKGSIEWEPEETPLAPPLELNVSFGEKAVMNPLMQGWLA